MERRGCHGLEATEPPQKIGRTSISLALDGIAIGSRQPTTHLERSASRLLTPRLVVRGPKVRCGSSPADPPPSKHVRFTPDSRRDAQAPHEPESASSRP